MPSPALTTAPRIQPACASRCGAPDAECRTTTASAPIASQRQRGVLEALALGDARALGGEVDDVGGEPLGGGLEGDAGAGGVLVEEVDDGAAAQGGQLLDLAALRSRPSARRCRGRARRRRCRGRRPRAGAASAASPDASERHLVDAVDLGRAARCTRSAQRRRQVLADVVGADGQLAVARGRRARRAGPRGAGRGRSARRGRRGWCGRRTARRRRGPRPCRRSRRRGSSVRPAPGPAAQPQVVAVHRDVQRADRDGRGPRSRARRRASRRASGDAAGGDAEQDQVVGALVAFEDLVGDPGQRPADLPGVEDGPRPALRRRLVVRADVMSADLLPRLTGRVLKDGAVGPARPGPTAISGGRARLGRTRLGAPGRMLADAVRTARTREEPTLTRPDRVIASPDERDEPHCESRDRHQEIRRSCLTKSVTLRDHRRMAIRLRTGAGRPTARDPHAAGSVPARRRGEVRGPLEGGRRRLLRARRPRRHRAAARRARRLLRRAGPELLPDARADRAPRAAAEARPRPRAAAARCPPRRPARWPATPRRSRASAATTTARCSRSARTTCAPLAVIYDVPPACSTEQLITWGVLNAGRPPRRRRED